MLDPNPYSRLTIEQVLGMYYAHVYMHPNMMTNMNIFRQKKVHMKT